MLLNGALANETVELSHVYGFKESLCPTGFSYVACYKKLDHNPRRERKTGAW